MNLYSLINRLLRRDPNMQPNICYSQEGEDLLLDRLLCGQNKGFYVDVGAHHPARFSNTYLFYKRGWCGINIDAMPGSMQNFDKVRPRDINVECGVASVAGTLMYYRFNEPALNTFDTTEAAQKNKPPYQVVDRIEVTVECLDTLLDRYLRLDSRLIFFPLMWRARTKTYWPQMTGTFTAHALSSRRHYAPIFFV